MPRGKYVNHKGRSRHFTSPEELQQEKDESSSGEETSSEGEKDDAAAGAGASTSKPRAKPKPRVPAKKASAAAASSSEEEDSEESSEDDRDARKGVAALIEIENPNRAVKKATVKLNNLAVDTEKPTAAAAAAAPAAAAAKPELSRREREQIEKQKARQRYEKLHAAGKTSEAKADLARLALIRQQRAEAAAKREADKKAVEDKKSTSTQA